MIIATVLRKDAAEFDVAVKEVVAGSCTYNNWEVIKGNSPH